MNFCEEVVPKFNFSNKVYSLQCMKYINIEIKHQCLKTFECTTLVFDNDMMFEGFFMQDLFPTQLTFIPRLYRLIHVNEFNINIDSSQLEIGLGYQNRSQDLKLLTIEGNFSFIRLNYT